MLLKKSIKIILVFAFLIIFLILLAAMFSFPLSTKTMTNSFFDKTGIRLVINGKVELYVIPKTHIKIYDAYITNAQGGVIASFQTLDIDMGFISLFASNPKLNQVVFNNPKIFLDVLLNSSASLNAPSDLSEHPNFNCEIRQITFSNGTMYNNYNQDDIVLNTFNVNAAFKESKLFTLLSFNKSNVSFSSTIVTNFITPTLSLKNAPGQFELVALISGGTLGSLTSNINATGQIAYKDGITYVKTDTTINNLDLNLLATLYGFSLLRANDNSSSKPLPSSTNNLFSKLRASINLSSVSTNIYNNNIDNLNAIINIDKSNILSDFTATLLGTKASGKFALYNNNNLPYLYTDIKIDNLLLSKLSRVIDRELINGTLKAEINLAAFINDINSFKASLTGKGNFHINNGFINGDKISYMTDILSTLVGTPLNVNPVTFKDITATFEVKNGEITNNDLVIDADKCYLTGKGSVNLYYNTINYILIPSKFIETIYEGIETGFTIQGSLTKPIYKVDLENYLNYLNHKHPKPTFGNVKKVN